METFFRNVTWSICAIIGSFTALLPTFKSEIRAWE